VSDDGSWTGRRLRIAFAVTEASSDTAFGDFHTALELGESLAAKLGWNVWFVPRDEWYSPCDFDVVIAMTDNFDPAKLTNRNPEHLTVAWMRNWFDRWVDQPSFGDFDVYLASSAVAAEFAGQVGGVEVRVLRLATNPDRFDVRERRAATRYDYVFTGNCWGAPRQITEVLKPHGLPLRGAIFGKGWENEQHLRAIHKGFTRYDDLPDVYRSTKLVIDDANHVTKPWGSVNSRVFDALASGALVVTNGEIGSGEVFDGALPVYHDEQELARLLENYSADDAARERLVEELRRVVIERHTYDRRADELLDILRLFREERYRIALKTPVPNYEVAHEWGDSHFAHALKRALKKRGHSVRVDILPEWDRPQGVADDVVIVLRGLSKYIPRPGQINVLWLISHPDKVADDEFELYDHVFVASLSFAAELRERVSVPVTALLQCTDPELFRPPENGVSGGYDVLFVGNTRNQYRKAVKDAVDAGLPLTVVGAGWDAFLDRSYIAGSHIPQENLHAAYAAAEVVLNDHWPSMADKGFLSNRLFDVAASGGFVISDRVVGIEDIFGDAVPTFDSPQSLRDAVAFFLQNPEARAAKVQQTRELVQSAHTFDHRADVILEVVKPLHRDKSAGARDDPLEDGTSPTSADTRNLRDDALVVASLPTGPGDQALTRRRSFTAPTSGQVTRINLGCGPKHILPDWWNVDIRPFPGVDQVFDATERWPFPEASLEYVFGEHFIEHLDVEGAIRLLEEARRCLVPAGRIRLSTPSLEWVVSTHFPLGSQPDETRLDDTLRINRAFHGWGHQFLYSRPMLVHLLHGCGFADISFHEYGKSGVRVLTGLERHGKPSVQNGNPGVWIVEATPAGASAPSTKELREWVWTNLTRHVRSGH
jgi:O-antigen biosynthesis protein